MCRMHPADELEGLMSSDPGPPQGASRPIERLVPLLKEAFALLTDEQRKEVAEGYCRDCFRPLSETAEGVCHCEDDE